MGSIHLGGSRPGRREVRVGAVRESLGVGRFGVGGGAFAFEARSQRLHEQQSANSESCNFCDDTKVTKKTFRR